jgi:DNA-binding NarL/FixJ family response regulator
MAPQRKRPLRILLADDHRLIRTGIRSILPLATASLYCELDEAETTEIAIQKASTTHYDVILMDFQLPAIGGDKATRIILANDPAVSILGLSTFGDRGYVTRMMDAGAKGYLLKNIEPDILVTAIKTAAEGKPYFSNEIALLLMEKNTFKPIDDPLENLTSRERELFRLTVSGLSDDEVAARMQISLRTVDKHRQHLKAKLGVRRTHDLYHLARKIGLLQ